MSNAKTPASPRSLKRLVSLVGLRDTLFNELRSRGWRHEAKLNLWEHESLPHVLTPLGLVLHRECQAEDKKELTNAASAATSPESRDPKLKEAVEATHEAVFGGASGSAAGCDGWCGSAGECCTPHRLLLEAECNGNDDGQDGNADGNPGSDGVRSAKSPLKLMLAEQAITSPGAIIPSGNPFAQLLVRLFAKAVGVEFWFHGVSVEVGRTHTDIHHPMDSDHRHTKTDMPGGDA